MTQLTIEQYPLESLIPYANNAKEHTKKQINQIAASIQEYGFNDPIAVWHDADGHPVIIEGHGRALAAQKLHMATVPVICLDELSDTQRRQYTLVHNQLTMNTGWDIDTLNAELDALENTWDATAYDFTPPTLETPAEEYLKHVGAIQYTPSGKKWRPEDLYTLPKTDLLRDIQRVESEELRTFLTVAYYRLAEMNFPRIADYYCDADPQTQRLMERLALVIIDTRNAIENGYMDVQEKMADESITQ